MYKPKEKWVQHSIHLRRIMDQEVRMECHRLGISFQSFIRSLVTDYFLRKYGKDVNTNTNDHGI